MIHEKNTMPKITIHDFLKKKREKQKITMLNAYDCGFRHTRTVDPVHPNSSFA